MLNDKQNDSVDLDLSKILMLKRAVMLHPEETDFLLSSLNFLAAAVQKPERLTWSIQMMW